MFVGEDHLAIIAVRLHQKILLTKSGIHVAVIMFLQTILDLFSKCQQEYEVIDTIDVGNGFFKDKAGNVRIKSYNDTRSPNVGW